ncbi:MAG: hypothetical protein MUO30_01850 [Anaerolineales bacterium]|nr:hypothetical protein [Anaerolineales bacterium]
MSTEDQLGFIPLINTGFDKNLSSAVTNLQELAEAVDNLFIREKLTAARTYYIRVNLGACTMTSASPCVVTLATHGLSADDPIVFKTTDTLYTGVVEGKVYYVLSTNLTANTFKFSASVGGAPVNTSGSQAGVHSLATGNDANTGLAQTRAGAFLNISAAITAVYLIDMGGYNVTLQLAKSTYGEYGVSGVQFSMDTPLVGRGNVILAGDDTTPNNCRLATWDDCVVVSGPTYVMLGGVELTASAGSCLNVYNNGFLEINGPVRFGPAGFVHVFVHMSGIVTNYSDYDIFGGASAHLDVESSGVIQFAGQTITLIDVPDFGVSFAIARNAILRSYDQTFVDTATGKRFSVTTMGFIDINGDVAGLTYFPGDVAGTIESGGVYNATHSSLAFSFSATDKVLGRETAGAGEGEEIPCTAAGRAILDDANAAAQLATLGASPTASPTFTGTVILPKAIEIQDTSADHQYVLAVSELTADRTVTLPLLTAADVFVFAAFIQTLTNKRITKRTDTIANSSLPTINTDLLDFFSLTAQTQNIASFTTNLSGTPTENQTLWIAITGTAARTITWGNKFEASTVALPTTTVTTARLDVFFVWNIVTSKWRCMRVV